MRGAGRIRGVLKALPVVAVAFAVSSAPASAGVANAGVSGAPASNPLAGLPWGNYTGNPDEVFPSYRAAHGEQKRLLGLIALRPRVRWYGPWNPDSVARLTSSEYIANVTGGNPNVLSQVAVFRLDPWEGEACKRLPTAAERASYKRWIDGFAAGIGPSRVALILQPDLPFWFCVPHHSPVPVQLVSYAVRRFNSLPHTTVYIDAGSSDWVSVDRAVTMLRGAGVRYARGFALNATHYDSNEHEILYGAQVVRALARDHLAGKHFVINTASNGRPFTFQQYHGGHFDNAAVCRTRRSVRCVTLGIPPTWHVTDRRWGLPGNVRSIAGRLVDAYLWIGRPWLDNQAQPFDLQRSLQMARTTPY
jgi:endoglucanase